MDEQRTDQRVAGTVDTLTEKVHHYFAQQTNVERLYGILCSYVRRWMGNIKPEAARRDIAYELLDNVFIKAYELAEKDQNQEKNMHAWLQRIANNLVMQKRDELRDREKREPLIGQLQVQSTTSTNQEDFFEYFQASMVDDPQQFIGEREQLMHALNSLSAEDQEIVILNKHYGLNFNEIAQRLGITPGATRVRSTRALDRLRSAWETQENGKRGENDE